MSKYRRAARVDENQSEIVAMLRSAGFSVELGHDDILVGYAGKTYWVEIKDPKKTLNKDGSWKAGALKDSQLKLQREWKGAYLVATSFEQIVDYINGDNNG